MTAAEHPDTTDRHARRVSRIRGSLDAARGLNDAMWGRFTFQRRRRARLATQIRADADALTRAGLHHQAMRLRGMAARWAP